MKSKYDKAETSVDKICCPAGGPISSADEGRGMLDQMYQVNLNYFKELSMYILAGKRRLNEVRTHYPA